jgi:ABC-type bacteriocin/lantibiotic exporter with double-glycine peptidase domain
MASTLQWKALWDFVAFCWRQTRASGRQALAFEALFLELGNLVIPLYTSFVLVSLGKAASTDRVGEGLLIAPFMVAATGLILLFLAARRYVEPRLKRALAEDDAAARRHMLAVYERSGRLEKVDPETFDDEFDQFSRLGRLVGRDTVKVSAYAMAVVVFIPVELIFTGPILLISLCMAWITLELVLMEGDSYRRAQWEMAGDSIETTALRRLWMRYIRTLSGAYSNNRLMKGLFKFLDHEYHTFRRKQLADKKLFGTLDLITNIERIVLMTVAAIGIVSGYFDISQFVLILFVAGRLQAPLRGILQAWLSTGRPVQGMQAMQRLLKKEIADNTDNEVKASHALNQPTVDGEARQEPVIWQRNVPSQLALQDLGFALQSIAIFKGESITVNGSLIENLTLGQEELNEMALSLLGWSGLQPWVASLPNGVQTRLEEDNSVLPHYITQLISIFRVFLFNRDTTVVIDNRNAALEPETISGIVNALQRWQAHPRIAILGNDQAWSALDPQVVTP